MNALKLKENLFLRRKYTTEIFYLNSLHVLFVTKIWGWHMAKKIIQEDSGFAPNLTPGKYYFEN